MAKPNTDMFIALEEVRQVTRTRRGVELAIDQEKMRVDFIRSDLVRIKMSNGLGRFDETPTFAVTQDEFGAPRVKVNNNSKMVVLTSKAICVQISKKPFDIKITRTDGTPIYESVPGQAYRYLNNSWSVKRKSNAGDAYLGLGERTDALNQNGRYLQMWNTDILAPSVDGEVRDSGSDNPLENPTSDKFDPYYISIPFFYHLPAGRPQTASASFIDNGYHMHYDLTDDSEIEIISEGGQLTEYIFAGPSIKTILSRYTELTGRMQPPPIWALGHHQCRWHDYSDKDWIALGDTYRKKEIPCDTLWLDIHYMDEYRVFTWNKERFKNIRRTLNQLKRKRFRAITIIDPGVKYDPGYPVFDEGMERNLFCKTEGGQVYIGQVWPGRTAFPDFVKEETRRWWGRLNAQHVQSGLAGIWNDMNEPATGVVSPLSMRFDRDGANHSHERYHNQYAMLMAMGTMQGLREAMPELRTFILSRAGFAGIQRYAANWTGDNVSKWEHLAMSVYMNCNLGISGQPFVGSDVGGFCDNSQEELLIRWYQYGAFQPFFRNHSCINNIDQYPWAFGEEAEDMIRKAIGLRYSLLPYTYSSFMMGSESGEPIQRPLVYDYQDDPEARDNSTEYLFGPSLLVAPVVEKGQSKRRLYLPEGKWYCYHTGQRYQGGRDLTVDAPLDRIPVFVKAGAIVPTAEVVQSTMDFAPTEIALNVYVPTNDGLHESVLYEDDGITDKHRYDEHVTTLLTCKRKGCEVEISGAVSGKGFAEFNRKRFRLHFIGTDIDDVVIENNGKSFTRRFKV